MRVGRLMPSGAPVTAAFGDVLLAVMAPRSAKTTSLAVPAVLTAPGPVVVTSNKVRTIRKGWALLVATGAPAGLLRLEPCYTGPPKQQIATAERDAQHRATGEPQQVAGDPWELAR